MSIKLTLGLLDSALFILFWKPYSQAEDAGWARGFRDDQGKFSQEYWMYFKEI